MPGVEPPAITVLDARVGRAVQAPLRITDQYPGAPDEDRLLVAQPVPGDQFVEVRPGRADRWAPDTTSKKRERASQAAAE